MRALLIKYAVLYSKAGYNPAAAILCRLLEDMRKPWVCACPTAAFAALQDELAYSGAPIWLYNSLCWHLVELRESVQVSDK